MGEDQGGGRLGGEAGEVDAVPCGRCGGEDARVRTEGGGGVVAYAEAVAVVRAARIKAEAGIVGLGQDGVLRGEDQVGKQDRVTPFVDLKVKSGG